MNKLTLENCVELYKIREHSAEQMKAITPATFPTSKRSSGHDHLQVLVRSETPDLEASHAHHSVIADYAKKH